MAAQTIARLGKGTLLAKVDIEAAYRLVPVHPQDRQLQAVKWNDRVYVDPMLPFGLRSAPKIFNAIADALEWILHHQGVEFCEHYLDDFIILGRPDSPECQQALASLNSVCDQLGVPLAAHKKEGPTTCLTFLGIEIDTEACELRLPQDKLDRLGNLLSQWSKKKACTTRDLQSLVGHLNHACKVVRPGRSFLRRIIDLLQVSLARRHRAAAVRLNLGFRSDMAWWTEFVGTWNRTAFLMTGDLAPTAEFASEPRAHGGVVHGTVVNGFKYLGNQRHRP